MNDKSPTMNREQAWTLLNEYVKNPALLRHMLCVEAAMGHYAPRFAADADLWRLVGLLHDFDYERFPDPPHHTREGATILRARGVDEEVLGAILSHAPWNLEHYPRDTPLRKTLFAVDELCGFIYAAALLRPERIVGMKASSVLKKMKQKTFAAAVSREDIHQGAEMLGLSLDAHVTECLTAISGIAATIGLESAEKESEPRP